jgi:hypothetical protein
MQKNLAASFILSLIALFTVAAQNVPMVRLAVSGTVSVAHSTGVPPVLSTTVTPRSRPVVPSGSQTYQIMSGNTAGPHIIQATINPPDVHVGNVQKFTVVVSSAAALGSVVAIIETDHGTTTVPLSFAKLASTADVLPAQYAVDDHGTVVLADSVAQNGPGNIWEHFASAIFGKPAVSSVSAAPSPTKKYVYQGQWTVRDTHNTNYHTTFVAKDANGQEDSVTIAWSDACSIPQSGAWTISGPCTISSLDGVDRGNATIANQTLTLNAQFAYTPGYSVTISGTGKIVLGGSGSLAKGYLYYTDSDSDGYPANTTPAFSATTLSSPYVLRGNEAHYTSADCYDGNSYVYAMENIVTDADHDGYALNGSNGNVCLGASTTINGRTYYDDGSSNYAYLNYGQAQGWDCNDSDASKWRNLTGYVDNDGDGYGAGSGSQICSGVSLPSGYVSNNTDCYDYNADAYPGSPAWAPTGMDPTDRGDGSFDYNCDGQQTKANVTIGSCVGEVADNPFTCGGVCGSLRPPRDCYEGLTGWVSWVVPACGAWADNYSLESTDRSVPTYACAFSCSDRYPSGLVSNLPEMCH